MIMMIMMTNMTIFTSSSPVRLCGPGGDGDVDHDDDDDDDGGGDYNKYNNIHLLLPREAFWAWW